MTLKGILKTILPIVYIILIQIILLFLFALIIERSLIHYSAAPYLVLISSISSVSFMSFLISAHEQKISCVTIPCVAYVFLVIAFSLLHNEVNLMHSSILRREIVAVICGAIIGFFLGSHRHNKLRNSRKKRRFTTK